MTPAARTQATIELLTLWQTSQQSSPQRLDVLWQSYARARRYMGSKDRQAIAAQLYGVVRQWALLQARLAQASGQRWLPLELLPAIAPHPQAVAQPATTPAAAARLLVALALHATSPSQVAEHFCGDPHAPAPLSAAEQALLRLTDMPRALLPADVEANCPAWLWPMLQDSLGAQAVSELTAQQATAPVDLRVNVARTTREAVQQELAQAGVSAALIPETVAGLRLAQRVATGALACLADGRAEVQDSASQQVAMWVGAAPGQQILDMCAGAGGKSLALAAAMAVTGKTTGQIFACDVSKPKLQELKRRAARAGAENIQTHWLTRDGDPVAFWQARNMVGKFDRVLVDAPCTGTGVWRRNPDARWRLPTHVNLPELLAIQAKLLRAALALVHPKGEVVYATCSLLKAENHDQVAAALAATGAKLLAERQWLASTDNSDGFYAARLKAL